MERESGKGTCGFSGFYAGILSGLKEKLIYNLKLVVDMIGGSICEFMIQKDGSAFLKISPVSLSLSHFKINMYFRNIQVYSSFFIPTGQQRFVMIGDSSRAGSY